MARAENPTPTVRALAGAVQSVRRLRGTAQSLPCGRVLRAPQGPPLISRLSRRDPASGASSLADARALGARPRGLLRRFTPKNAEEASRRSSTSAIESLHEHDRGRSESRAPRRQSPTVAALFAGGYAVPLNNHHVRSLAVAVQWWSVMRGRWPTETSRARDRVSAFPPSLTRHLSCAIAREESFAPPR